MSSEREPGKGSAGKSTRGGTGKSTGKKSTGKPSRSRARQRAPQETSAGGVVIRGEPGREQAIVIVPTRRAPDGSLVLGLPKGHIDPGEDALQAATREVREEAGVVAERIADLGEVRYWYRRDGRTVLKAVVFFLFRYVSGDVAEHDDEIVEARWTDLREAAGELSYDGERGMVERAIEALEDGSAYGGK
jgi:8-oxo-dGTP pyrophosphatase MutT (NUDIX family)